MCNSEDDGYFLAKEDIEYIANIFFDVFLARYIKLMLMVHFIPLILLFLAVIFVF